MPILYIYILTALIAVGLCTLAGFFICCIFKLTLCWKKRTLRESNVDHEYYEVIDPIYEAVSAAITDSSHSGMQIRTENNDAYKSRELKETTTHASLGIDIENNEANIHISSELDVLQMDHNKSYQAGPFNSSFPERFTAMQECYETQSLCNYNENIQQASSDHANVHNDIDENVEFQNQGQSIPLCIENVDSNNSAVNYGSTELTFAQQLQGVYRPELSCEKQSINLKGVELHTVQ